MTYLEKYLRQMVDDPYYTHFTKTEMRLALSLAAPGASGESAGNTPIQRDEHLDPVCRHCGVDTSGDEVEPHLPGCPWFIPSAPLKPASQCAEACWQPIDTAPRDGTWILGCNNRGNQAVIIWKEHAVDHAGLCTPGWTHPFTQGELAPFFNSAFSYATHWQPLPAPPIRFSAAGAVRFSAVE